MLDKKVSLRILVALLVVCGLAAIAFGNIVRVTAEGHRTYGAIGDIALVIASIPKNFREGMALVIEGDKKDLDVGASRFGNDAGFKFNIQNRDGGQGEYLLLSHYDANRQRSVVKLVDMAANRIVHTWQPDFEVINERTQLVSNLVDIARDRTPSRYRVMHPLLLPDGDLVFQGTGPLIRIGPCNEIRWTLDGVFHHSNELHSSNGFWVAQFLEPQTIERVSDKFKEDAIVHVSENGEVLYRKSVAELLIENGLARHIYGQDFYTDDPTHLNDVQEALFDSKHWLAGDLFLSLRNISAIVQYRPSTNEVIWIKQGPWVNQHDVDILDESRIVIFNNNRFNYQWKDDVNGVNSVMIYDFDTDTVTSPYQAGMEKHDVRTISEGRSEIYPNGDVFVEESNYGRLLRLSPDGKIVWQYVNRAENGQVYRMNWSRVLSREHVESAIANLTGVDCS